MKRFIIIMFICAALMFSCRTTHNVTVKDSVNITTHFVDSVRYIDSIIPVERYADVIGKYDTLELETSQAIARCWADSIWLRGVIFNKKISHHKIVEKIKYKDSIIYKDKLVYKDKIVHKTNPINKILVWVLIFLIVIIIIQHMLRR